MAPIRTLERIKYEVVFADEAEARRYLDEQAQEGFFPAAPHLAGIVPQHISRGDASETTWLVAVEKQVYNGKTTPAYREGDRVVAEQVDDPTWQPVEATVIEVYGHKLKVQLDWPNANQVRTLECQDYEVRR